MRIFLSYGHDNYASLAVRLKNDLKAQKHEVWFDLERLKPGGDWERYIEDGLDWASAVPGNGRFLLLLTPHSVRRPDGYCINELARAFGRNLPIIPVMLSTVEPPLSICRLQWLDMRSCFPAEKHEARYTKHFEQLLTALLEKQVPFEGVHQRLVNYRSPVTYDDDLTKHLSRFTGREWVMREVDEWLTSTQRVLWITGEAGVGKSALAAWLCERRPEIVAYHFCRFGNSDRVDVRRVLSSLAYQLSTQLPVYQEQLNASPLDKTMIDTNVPAVFERLFANLLVRPVPIADKQQVLLIDALDEATTNGRNELAALIRDRVDQLPPSFRLIVTSRPYEQEINFALQALDPWKLDAGREENLQDIRAYLGRELRQFTGGSAPSEAIVDSIVDRSEGLFLYVSWVRQELQDGRLSLGRVEEFPRGLGGVYADFFERYFPNVREYESECRPALEAICTACEPLEPRDLAGLQGWSEYKMRSLTARLGSLFPVVDGRVRPFHQSVREWLMDPKRSGPYWIDVSEQEQRLADLAWKEYKNGANSMGRYSVLYAPYHLAACHRKRELRELLLDFDWIKAKFQAGGISKLLADYDLALDILSSKVCNAKSKRSAVSPTVHSAQMNLQVTTDEPQETVTDDSGTNALSLVQGAIRRSAHVITKDPVQFASQMVGRLQLHRGQVMIRKFTDKIVEGAPYPWLRPLHSALHPAGTHLVLTLESHSEAVQGVAVSADGRLAVSASEDQTLKVWDLETGRALRTLKGHSRTVWGVALSADGRLAVSASWDSTLKVWDVETGRALRTLQGHSDAINSVALSADGRLAVSASEDQTLRVWDLKTGRALRTLQGHSSTVWGVAVSADGRLAVSASEDQTLKVWSVETGRALRTLEGHTESVTGVAISGNGRRAVSASDDNTLKVWEVETGRALRTLQGHSDAVNGVALTADGRRAVSASEDQTLKVWDLETGRALRTLEGHSGNIWGVAVSADGRLAVSASEDQTLKVWDVKKGRALRGLEGHSGTVCGLAVSADGRRVVSASKDQTLKVWEPETGRALQTLEGHSDDVNDVAVSADGRLAVSASEDRTLKVWDMETGYEVRTLEGHSNRVFRVALSADGRHAVSASHDHTLKVWDVKMGSTLRTLEGYSHGLAGAAMTADGRRAISVFPDDTLKVWDVDKGLVLRTLEGLSQGVTAVAMSADGRRAVSASHDNVLQVWDLEKGREVCKPDGHSDYINDVAVSTNGRRAVSVSDDKTLKVWEMENGALIATFTCEAALHSCAFIGNNRPIAGDAGGRVHFLVLEEPKRRD